MKSWSYIFITSRQPKKLLPKVRAIQGIIHADALFGQPDIISIASGEDISSMDSFIDRIAELPEVDKTDTRVAKWIDGVGPPQSAI